MNPGTEVRQINCTRCGAPLALHGGHRVRTLTCAYCGAVLDVRQEYKVLAQYQNRKRPDTPFDLGAKGRIKGIEFTVIGLANYVSSDGHGWLEHQLYSPTHGYAWLSLEDGHLVFSRRIRDLPKPSLPKSLRERAPVYVKNRRLRVFEHYTASLRYVEGELTWIAKRGDTVEVTEAIDPPFVLGYEQSGQEIEYQWGEYLEAAEVYRAFGVKSGIPRPAEIHPAQPFNPPGWLAGMNEASKVFAPLALLGVLYFWIMGGGKPLLQEQLASGEVMTSAPFSIQDPNALLALELSSAVNNTWAAYDVTINRRADDAEVFSLAKEIGYYEGYEDGEHWSEGTQSARALFKLPEAGEYYLDVAAESEGEIARLPPLSVTLREGVKVTRYFLLLLVLFLFPLIWLPFSRYRFERRRWGEDDDE
jgi:hypothetical protein